MARRWNGRVFSRHACRVRGAGNCSNARGDYFHARNNAQSVNSNADGNGNSDSNLYADRDIDSHPDARRYADERSYADAARGFARRDD
jgi:hypothetical protein